MIAAHNKGKGSGAKSSLLHNGAAGSLSNQSPKQQQHMFKDSKSAKKNRPSLIRHLDIAEGALSNLNKLNLP
jgi:hypothetical protein